MDESLIYALRTIDFVHKNVMEHLFGDKCDFCGKEIGMNETYKQIETKKMCGPCEDHLVESL